MARFRSLPPHLEEPLERFNTSQVSRLGECAIESRNVTTIGEMKVWRSEQRGGRKSVLTHDSTRSSAAAYGSEASGSASNVWHGTPADRRISRAT